MFVLTLPEFVADHGGNPININLQNGTWLLPDGASYMNNAGGLQMFDPPVNENSLLKARRHYHTAKLEIVSSHFAKLKHALMGHGVYTWDARLFGPDTGRDGKGALLKLKALADQHKEAIASIDEQLANLPSVKLAMAKEEEARRTQMETAAREAAARAELESITL